MIYLVNTFEGGGYTLYGQGRKSLFQSNVCGIFCVNKICLGTVELLACDSILVIKICAAFLEQRQLENSE